MYIMFNVESVALKKLKFLCFASKEEFLKSECVKSNLFWKFKQVMADCKKFRQSTWESSHGVHL